MVRVRVGGVGSGGPLHLAGQVARSLSYCEHSICGERTSMAVVPEAKPVFDDGDLAGGVSRSEVLII